MRIGIDIGGTFTDLVAETPGGLVARKVLTTPRAPEEGVLAGLAIILEATGAAPGDVSLVIHGTTLATNAIIERKGARTALVATAGHRDTVEIADEGRFDQYDVFLVKPAPLVPRELRFTVPERVDWRGEVLLPLDEAAVAAVARALVAARVEAVAVSFLHAFAAPAHERRVREILMAEAPHLYVSLSSDVAPEIREYERTSTTCANAYVQPIMDGYLERLERGLSERGFAAPVLMMTSGGGLTTVETARRVPVRLVESGPAGGAILAASIAASLGERHLLAFDMGGTTAKLTMIEDGRARTARTFEVDRSARFMKGSGLPIRIPVIEMVEIGAGGGSLARVDAMGRLQIGPDSAGSEPGPVSYGRGGERPAVTDADLLLGHLDPEAFAGGTMRLDAAAAASAVDRDVGGPLGLPTVEAAHAIREIVDENMASAARRQAVEAGADIARYSMIAFGGAAPLHAARLADKLGVARVIVPADAGVGSAVGFLRAPIAYEAVASLYMRLSSFDPAAANGRLAEMRAEAEAIVRAGAPTGDLDEVRLALARYVGQGHEVAVPLPARDLVAEDAAALRAAFEEAYAAQFVRIIPDGEIELLSFSLTLSKAIASAEPPVRAPSAGEGAAPTRTRRMFDAGLGRVVPAAVVRRADLVAGRPVPGPCLVEEQTTTTVVPSAFAAHVDARGNLVLVRKEAPEAAR